MKYDSNITQWIASTVNIPDISSITDENGKLNYEAIKQPIPSHSPQGFLYYNSSSWKIYDDNNISTSNLTTSNILTVNGSEKAIEITNDSIFANVKVGIGVANPTSNLDVAGDINFTGNLTQNGIPFSSFTISDVINVLSTAGGEGITWNSSTSAFDIDSGVSGGCSGGGNFSSLWGETTSNNLTYLYYNSNVKIDGDLLVSGSIISGWNSSLDTTLNTYTSGGGGGWW